ncbi:uncharacterized protein F5Z01DRAFT_724849 [Emericellopsis atlantica]|uniref:Sialidase n=1 Tax=Emericellopsis atlantica TaxID=2614577 RepID=A0A9P7ZKQ9_9HYPO|nr:uncharacterized protein F5Z01DRAFT_724849 [Emericellopsis atlantica]KAG9253487.1 hypothetical protein F5Z01DRAFT_724849 [Emericellopsis atlantica]
MSVYSQEADLSFDFGYPYSSFELPVTSSSSPELMPVMDFALDPVFLDLDLDLELASGYQPYTAPEQAHKPHTHTRSSSRASIYSSASTVDSTSDSVCTRLSTPPRASPPVHHHGPILLPKIRSQDQDVDTAPPRHHHISAHKTVTPPPAPRRVKTRRPAGNHARSYTNPETLSNMAAFAHMSFSTPTPQPQQHQLDDSFSNSLLCSPASFAPECETPSTRRSSSVDAAALNKYGYPTYRQAPVVQQPDFTFPSAYTPRAPSPLAVGAAAASVTPEPTPSSVLKTFLTSPNPAASLVRTVSFPHRDPNIKHFWWDVRSVRSWSSFTASTILSLPGASGLLSTPVPATLLPQPAMSARHPETEAALHSIYASYYLPKLNAALALSSSRPLHITVPSAKKPMAGTEDLLFAVNPAGESSTASAMFGGKPSARVVGLVRTFDRFNTGMRVEGNIKRVEYLRGLAALHYAMREHGCRYGFILTEIELVVVRNGTQATPFFGDLEIASVQLAAAAPSETSMSEVPLTACLALWGLCQMASNSSPQPPHAHWRSEIGAPAEGTRRKAKPRDSWMPAPQLAEKREAKRTRGWIWPEDAIGRKEMGRRGVRYNGI